MWRFIKGYRWFLIIGILLLAWLGFNIASAQASVSMKPAYDLSEWQKEMNLSQVQKLKSETSFLILRAQYGSNYHDRVLKHNLALVQQVGIPYGVYSYSLYANASDASNEAKSLHRLAPNANFYVNDMEENTVKSGSLVDATIQWAKTMKSITNKPVVLYSGLSFMNTNLTGALSAYNAIWIASYNSYEPNPSYSYDLWQYTDRAYSSALNQNVDASIIPTGGKALSYWTNGRHTITKYKASLATAKATNTKAVSNNKIGTKYYANLSSYRVKVTEKSGIYLYNDAGRKLKKLKYGSVVNVKYIQYRNGISQLLLANYDHITGYKKAVRFI